MSKKTIRKRIALVAVSALGGTLLSVLSIAPANAQTDENLSNNSLSISTARAIDGVATAAAASADISNAMDSAGWSADTSATTQSSSGASTGTFVYAAYGAGTDAGTYLRTANVFAGAALAFKAKGSPTAAAGLSVVVSGGTLTQLNATQVGAGATGEDGTLSLTGNLINAAATTVVVTNSATNEIINGVFSVSAAVGQTAVISVYTGSDIIGLASATSGILAARYTLTVISASVSGVYNAAESTVAQQACIANDTTTPGTNAYDTVSSCRNGYVGAIYVDLEDAFGAAVTSGYTFTASSSASKVIISDTQGAGTTVNGASSGFSSDTADSDGSYWVYVAQPATNTAGSTVVTLAINGATIGTKTISWQGDIATLAIDTANSCSYMSTNQADTDANIGGGCVVYVAKDAAGNVVTLGSHPSVAAATGALVGATTSSTTAAAFGAYQTNARGYGYTMLVVPANPLSGKSTYQLSIVNAAGASVKSNTADVTVSRGSTDSFAISWDKATYNFGDIATLTITGKDAYGNLMADGTTLAGLALTVNSGGFASVGTACSTSSYFVNGKVTCKYSALNTEGVYAYSVDLTTATPQAASVGSIPLKPSVSVVSNAEVLAAIVKLIASINKQIANLQKLIRKR